MTGDFTETSVVTARRVAAARARSLGAVLVEQGKLSPEAVPSIERLAIEKSIRFGEAAVQLGLLTEDDIESALASQYDFPLLATGEKGVDPAVVAAYDPQNNLVNHLRALRTQLVFRWLDAASRRILAVTSPDHGEGRSWLAANLAVALAQIGKRTLLIDADLRNPQQHRLFNLDNSLGLSALLTGRSGPKTAQIIHPQMRLTVMPAGPVPPNPEELLARPQFAAALDRVGGRYDVVLLDTPPAMASTDAQLVASKAGNAIIIARSNYTRRASLLTVMASLAEAKVNVVGSVVNSYSVKGL